jgi:hypothetical protein
VWGLGAVGLGDPGVDLLAALLEGGELLPEAEDPLVAVEFERRAGVRRPERPPVGLLGVEPERM